MTTAVAEPSPPVASAEAKAWKDMRWKDRYGWLIAQRKGIARAIESGNDVPGADFQGLQREVGNWMRNVELKFVGCVENIVERMVQIQFVWDEPTYPMRDRIEDYRLGLMFLLQRNPSLLLHGDALFEWALANGIRRGASRLADRFVRDIGPDIVSMDEDFEARAKAECRYCFEQVAAFDGRECRDLGNGRKTGRAMDHLDHLTYPPEVTRVINAGRSEPDDRLPILEEGRMAQDPPGVTYERILERDRLKTPTG